MTTLAALKSSVPLELMQEVKTVMHSAQEPPLWCPAEYSCDRLEASAGRSQWEVAHFRGASCSSRLRSIRDLRDRRDDLVELNPSLPGNNKTKDWLAYPLRSTWLSMAKPLSSWVSLRVEASYERRGERWIVPHTPEHPKIQQSPAKNGSSYQMNNLAQTTRRLALRG